MRRARAKRMVGRGTLKLETEVDEPPHGVAPAIAPLLLAAAMCRRTESADVGIAAS